ncbi:MAG: copper chaperone PCu(A)C [Gammaproteobacteria bacterium]|nr:copper chaperone PCu(A)C [Gammaproteobacteria bacterium]MDH5799975.1 copper chaperone PCu(A)C [Gammaproteobacteria bacterium]
MKPSKLILSLTLIYLLPAAMAQDTLQISAAKVRQAPPGLKVTAAYLSIHNPTAQDLTLVSLQSPAADKVEIHESVNHGDMVSMEHRPRLRIPAHSNVELNPNGLHLMLMGLKQTLKVDETISLTLHFEKHPPQHITLVVTDMRGDQTHKRDSRQDHSHDRHEHGHH